MCVNKWVRVPPLTLGGVCGILRARFSVWECPNGVIKKEKVKNGY